MLFFRRRSSHDDTWQLLPWLAQGTLRGRELRKTLDHLKTCSACREELRYLPELRSVADEMGAQRLPDPSKSYSRLRKRLEATGEGRASELSSGTFRIGGPRALWAGALLLVLAVGWAVGPGPELARFRVLSGAETEAPRGPAHFRVVFAPETPERRLREILLGAGLELTHGPSLSGAYALATSPGAALSPKELARLRALEEIELLEPIVSLAETAP